MEEDNDDVEAGGVDPEVKPWVEALLLNQIAGVEILAGCDTVTADRDDSSSIASGLDSDLPPNKANSLTAEDRWSPSSVEATARFMGAMLPSIAGDHAAALVRLKSFPLSYRLHPNMWIGECEDSEEC
jgi:hypothetical protein